MDALVITADSPSAPDVRALLVRHFELMRATSPAESCHVMEPDTLLEKDATLFAARLYGDILGVGALTIIGSGHGELKSMHTAQSARGRGVGHAILNALIEQAKEQGLLRLSLETGSADAFAPARALYEAHGFVICPPFGDYVDDPLSVFMTRAV